MKYFSGAFRFSPKPNRVIVLRFNPIQIAEWLEQLCRKIQGNIRDKIQKLSEELGVVKCRIIQFLNLLRLPVDLRARLKRDPNVAEGNLRPYTRMDAVAMRTAIERMLGCEVLPKAG
jgi:hypothetical protein